MFQCRASDNQVRVQEGRSQMLEYFFNLHIQEQMFRDMGEISEFCETEATDARTIDGEAIGYYYGLITRSPTERLNAAKLSAFLTNKCVKTFVPICAEVESAASMIALMSSNPVVTPEELRTFLMHKGISANTRSYQVQKDVIYLLLV